jgi:large subunit ribosomal protein L15
MSLNQLKAPKGANRERKRVGRGQGSGLGKTAGRGGKGQKARSGNMHFEGFEGGQMPLQRRLPKFGFNNVFRRELDEVQVTKLSGLPPGSIVDQAALAAAGLVRKGADGVVLLGQGELTGAYTVKVDRVTAGARAAVEKAGGKVDPLPRPQSIGDKEKAARAIVRAAKLAARPPRPAAAPAKVEGEPKPEKQAKAEGAPKAEKKAKAAGEPKAEKKPKTEGQVGEQKPKKKQDKPQ